MKKTIAFGLASALTLALCVPAFAADVNMATKIDGSYTPITIAVTVPATAKATINPYKMPFQAKSGDDDSVITTAGQIATQPVVVSNETNVDLAVNATVTAKVDKTAGSQVTLSTSAVKPTSTDKSVQVWFEAKRDTTMDETTKATEASIWAAFNNWEPSEAYDKSAKNQIICDPAAAQSKEGIAVLSAATKSGSTYETAKGGVMLYRLAGTCAKNPTKAWVATDTFSVDVAFTFAAVEAEKATAALTLDSTKKVVTCPAAFKEGTTYTWSVGKSTEGSAPTITAVTTAGAENTATFGTALTDGKTTVVKCRVITADGVVTDYETTLAPTA